MGKCNDKMCGADDCELCNPCGPSIECTECGVILEEDDDMKRKLCRKCYKEMVLNEVVNALRLEHYHKLADELEDIWEG